MNNKDKKLDKLTENAKNVLAKSYSLAKKLNQKTVLPEHVFIALLSLDRGLAARFLRSLGIDVDKTVESVKSRLPKKKSKVKKILVSKAVKDLIKNAFRLASEYKHIYVGTEHILLALIQDKNLDFVKELELAGLDFDTIRGRLFEYATYAPGIFVEEKEMGYEKPTATEYFGRSLNELYQKGKLMPIIGRNEEINRTIRILARQTKNNPILVGDAGVGKTAVVEGLVQKIEKGEVPHSLKDLVIHQIDLASIIAGSKVRGDVEKRLLALISEVSSSPNKVLFIDEIHMIVGAGATGSDRSMDIANILKPRLTDGSIRVIGATTLVEYRRYFEGDSALARRFQSVLVDEISEDDAIKVLSGIKSRFEEYHGVKITEAAVKAAVKLSRRYIANRYLPDKAIDALDEAAAEEKLKREEVFEGYNEITEKLSQLEKEKEKAIEEKKYEEALGIREEELSMKDIVKTQEDDKKKTVGKYKVDGADIKRVVSEWTGIPLETMSTDQKEKMINLEDNISEKIIGQEEAVERVASALKRARVDISDENRPLASLFFLGPTGVGKTEMAKVIADEFFGSEAALFQVDMSEFMEQHSVAKIIGSPPGYVGYREGGQLTEKVRKRPYSVVLFDEIEKAHPEMINILLQILEEGHITDSKGKKINFKNTVIIMTSNIGAEDIGKDDVLGFRVKENTGEFDQAYDRMRKKLIEDLKKELRPEFLNRIDDVVIFRGLDEKDAVKIASILVDDLKDRLEERDINLSIHKSSLKLIAKEGFSEEYGARNIRRKIQEMIENPLADILLESDEQAIDVKIRKKKDKLFIEKVNNKDE